MISSRRLAQTAMPDLELLEAKPDRVELSRAPVLFVHGAFAGAWCWREAFLPYFAEQGREAAALSLGGHGASAGGAELRRAGLEDLISDLVRGLEALPRPPVVIAHSLGGYLAQLLIGRARFRALVLMGSLPPDGMALIGPRLAVTDTAIWSEAVSATIADSKRMIDQAGLQVLFGEGVPPEDARRYGALMVPEAPRALAEAHLPRPVMTAMAARLPTVVLSGAADRLVWPVEALRTAAYHGAGYKVFERGGHFLMLDPIAREVGAHILDWLAARDL